MAKPENPGSQGEAARNKPNKGQDENLHNLVNPATGETRQATQREFKNIFRDLGFVKQEDADEQEAPVVEEAPVEQAPV